MTTSGSSGTFGEFKALVALSLSDPTYDLYSEELIYRATLGAINAVMPYCPKPKVETITGDGLLDSFELPSDIYKLEAIQDVSAGLFLDRAILAPGQARNANNRSPINWLEYPRGYMYFSRIPELSAVYRVYYQTYYNVPSSSSDDSFVFETPKSAMFGMLYWAMAHCIVPGSISSAQIRQFNTRLDSGTPVDNVLEASARFCRALFIDEMNRQPKYFGATS